MPRIFAKGEGAVITIAGFGRATEDTPAVVPAEVAEELRGRKDLRIRWDGEDPRKQEAAEDEDEEFLVEQPGDVVEFVDVVTGEDVPAVTMIEPAPGALGRKE